MKKIVKISIDDIEKMVNRVLSEDFNEPEVQSDELPNPEDEVSPEDNQETPDSNLKPLDIELGKDDSGNLYLMPLGPDGYPLEFKLLKKKGSNVRKLNPNNSKSPLAVAAEGFVKGKK